MGTGEGAEKRGEPSGPPSALPLNYARSFSWVTLLFILLTSLGLSFFIASSVRVTLLHKQEDFSRLLAENLNSQIFRRFALPTILAGGQIALRKPTQYEHLDRVVRSGIEGLPVERLRIFDFSHLVAYSTDKEELGKADIAPPDLEEVLKGKASKSEIVSSIPPWEAWFHLPLEAGTFVMRVLYPLKGEPFGPGEPAHVMGALELTQDITDDYERVMAFQGIIVIMCLLSSIVLFGVLLMLIHYAEKVIAERIVRNQKLENEIHSNEKLVSMGRVVASIAHEIRNPLGIIRSSAELLQKRTEKTDKGTARILGAIYDESVRLSRTVNDFLDYARPRVPRRDTVDINGVLDRAIAFLESEFGKYNIKIINRITESLYVIGDKDLLYRAFYNILVNSQQAIGKDGEITLTGKYFSPSGKGARDNRLQEMVEIVFTDSGPGFNADTLQNILDPFFTTKAGGTGLGLPIVQSIITGHNGRIELDNAKTGGAMVKVELPAAKMPEGEDGNG